MKGVPANKIALPQKHRKPPKIHIGEGNYQQFNGYSPQYPKQQYYYVPKPVRYYDQSADHQTYRQVSYEQPYDYQAPIFYTYNRTPDYQYLQSVYYLLYTSSDRHTHFPIINQSSKRSPTITNDFSNVPAPFIQKNNPEAI
ncbi:hypothetical protein SNE40_021349 [Patella caerulea]|uniref:Uncharacterized protein n=1 Tax=Patella caerulea TaxID=87958 RepID=A0AAN8GIL9_PATCE